MISRRVWPPPPTAAAPATYGCRYAGYSPEEWLAEVSGVPFGLPVSPLYLPTSPCISLYLPISQVSGVPFGLPGQILGTNADQAQVRATRGGVVSSK